MDVLSIVFLIAGGGWGLFVLFFGFTAVLNRPLSRVMQRRAERRARQAELRRRKKLDPITDMVEWKARRRVEEHKHWLEQWHELMPQSGYDYAALFSGEPARVRQALIPSPGTAEKPVVIAASGGPVRIPYQLRKLTDGSIVAVWRDHMLLDKTGKPWDGKHHRTCPYECDCPDDVRRFM